MTYKYYNVYISGVSQSPKNDYLSDMQEIVNDQFYNSSDWYTIQEETSFGSGEYSDLDVRINRVVDSTTGANQGDDWKKLLFKDIDKVVRIGAFFIFNSNYWVVVNTGNTSDLTSTCTVRRCNNTLRWIDLSGARHSIPCVLDYAIQENRDYSTGGSKVVNPSGILRIITQLNSDTNLIKANERFLFGNSGNWTSYKIFGGGIHNFNNPESTTISSTGLLTLTAGVTHLNEEADDLTNGYANSTERTYSITLNKSSITASISDTFQLEAFVFLNGETVTRDVNWSSSDETKATVSSTGLVTMVDTGSATITASLDGDSTVSSECSVTIDGTPISEYVVVVSPDTNYLLEGTSQTYNVILEKNGVAQADTFAFVIIPGNVPTANYSFSTIDGNNFSLENIDKYISESLVIRATSGIYVEDISILLRGAW